jgi:hypothetical protein
MPLPAHLAKYSGLIDLVVAQLVREIEGETEIKTPPGVQPGGVCACVNQTLPKGLQPDENYTAAAIRAANP